MPINEPTSSDRSGLPRRGTSSNSKTPGGPGANPDGQPFDSRRRPRGAQEETFVADKKPLTEVELHSRIRRLRDDARGWIDTELSPDQEIHWRYYNGRCDLKADVNRSKFVMTEIRDGTEAALVSINRIMLTADTPVEFKPSGPDDMELAQQQADVGNHTFFEENLGFTLTQDSFRDALVAGYGVFKTWWDTQTTTESIEYTGLTPIELEILASDDQVEIDAIEVVQTDGSPPDFQDLPTQGQVNVTPPNAEVINVQATRHSKEGRVRIDAVPTEEFLIDKWSIHPDDPDTVLTGQDSLRRVQDIVNEGIASWGDIRLSQQSSATTSSAGVRSARTEYQPFGTAHWTDGNSIGTGSSSDQAVEFVRVSELYVRIDANRDGKPVLYRAIMLSDSVISAEPWDKQPYSVGSPFRRPHAALGYGLGFQLKDVQDLSTALMRASLDAVYQAVNPQKIITKDANRADVLANRFGGVIRARTTDAIQPLQIPFVGESAVGMLDVVENLKENRTGISKASQGLDPDALQSSTEFGVVATISAAQAKVETIARNLIEGLLAPCFRKIAELTAQHLDQEKVFRLRNEFIQVDPRSWKNIMDTRPAVGIGRGTQLEKTQTLQQVIAKQEQILQLLGPDNPLTSIQQYSRSLNDVLKANGTKEANRYFHKPDISAQIEQKQREAEANKPPEIPPEIQIEQAKLKLQQEKQQAELQLKQAEKENDIQLARVKAEQEIRVEEAQAASQMQLEQARLANNIEIEQLRLQNELQLEEARAQARIEVENVEAAHKMALNETELEAEIELEEKRIEEMPEDPKSQGNVNRSEFDNG